MHEISFVLYFLISDSQLIFYFSANEQLNVNASQPTTMIQVRLADGSRLSARFNHSHTVSDIRSYIRA